MPNSLQHFKERWQKLPGWIRLGFDIALILAVLLAVRAYVLRDALSGTAPIIQTQQVDGQPFDLRQYRGEPAMVYFWATWCPICGVMDESVASIAEDYQVIGVAFQSGTAAEIQTHMQEAGWQMPMVNDRFGEWAKAYGVRGVPTAFFLDAEGEVRWIEPGLSSGWGLRLRLWALKAF